MIFCLLVPKSKYGGAGMRKVMGKVMFVGVFVIIVLGVLWTALNTPIIPLQYDIGPPYTASDGSIGYALVVKTCFSNVWREAKVGAKNLAEVRYWKENAYPNYIEPIKLLWPPN